MQKDIKRCSLYSAIFALKLLERPSFLANKAAHKETVTKISEVKLSRRGIKSRKELHFPTHPTKSAIDKTCSARNLPNFIPKPYFASVMPLQDKARSAF